MLVNYDTYERSIRYLLWFPIVLLVISVGLLSYNQITTGSFIERDVELTGGKMIVAEIVEEIDISSLRAVVGERIHVTTGVTRSLVIEIPFETDESEVISSIENFVNVESISVRSVGPALGSIFFQQTLVALIGAFVAMSILVLILFRSAVPSGLVVLAAATDIIVTLGVMSIINVPLSLPVLAALLMLIGYSVDTDILLTNRVLKSNQVVSERIKLAMKTGLTMTITTLVALTALYFATGAFVLEQIAIVLIIGLLIDIPATWFTNTGVLLWWVKKREA